MIIPKHYEDINVLHEGTMPYRTYYIPDCPEGYAEKDLIADRTLSKRMLLLNGNWKFRFYSDINDLKERFFEENFNTEGFEDRPVPGIWQFYGHDTHQYTNVRYPFPVDPPHILIDDPCGAYVYDFNYQVNESAPEAFLNFEGVDSCFYVWLNGQYVGYSQVTHNTSEFRITELLRQGKNTLAVLVLKWCDGSYMEDQDKLRMSGIIRDVYILERPENHIRDYKILSGSDGSFSMDIEYYGEPLEIEATLLDDAKNVIFSKKVTGHADEKIEAPRLWSCEDPYLYTLVLKTGAEVIVEKVGFRDVCIKDNMLFVNGRRTMIKGVNRHESDAFTGSVTSYEAIMKDLKAIRECNCNAIRTSHYPNVPYFYQLCDRYGFMVMDEADVESHGGFAIYFENDSFEERSARWNELVADNPLFTESIEDRVRGMYMRDKNRPCVLFWSIGNEFGYGCTSENALKFLKSVDNTRLTHYEGAYHRGRQRKFDYSDLDVYSRMYPSYKEVEEYCEGDPDKPFIMCEYSHAMGNGPGDPEDYFELEEKYSCMIGGFIWEWNDHGVYKGRANDGRDIFYYGGDSGEELHDGNFCMDGICYPDKRPHTGYYEYKNVNRPARLRECDTKRGIIVISNELQNTKLEEYADIEWCVTSDGEELQRGVLDLKALGMTIEAGERKEVPFSIEIPEETRAYLKLTYKLNRNISLLESGFELGFDETALDNGVTFSRMSRDIRNKYSDKNAVSKTVKSSDMTELVNNKSDNLTVLVEELDDIFVVKGLKSSDMTKVVNNEDCAFEYIYERKTGLFTSMVKEGEELIKKPMDISVWRAPTDNEMYVKEKYFRAFYDKLKTRTYSTEYTVDEGCAVIRSEAALVYPSIRPAVKMDMEWRINCSGDISFSIKGVRQPEYPILPRFSLRLHLNKKMENVEYFGLGPMENYIDKRRACWHGLFKTSVGEMHEDYVKPQENGTRSDCDYLKLSGGGRRLLFTADKPFSFNASVYSQEELTAKKHNYELEPSDSIILNLDHHQQPVGSNSCGPEPLEKYCFTDEKFEFGGVLVFE